MHGTTCFARAVIAASLVWAASPAVAVDVPPAVPKAASPPAAVVDTLAEGKDLRLALDDLVVQACMRNTRVAFEKMGWTIATEKLKGEEGLYDPELLGSYKYGDTHNPNTATDYYDQVFRDEFREKAHTYTLGAGGLLPTGARWTVDYAVYDRSNDLVLSRYRGEEDREYEAIIELTLRQPLLRDAGIDATTAKARAAEYDRDIAFQRYRLRMMEVAGSAISAYWDLFLAQKIRDIKDQSFAIRQRILADIEEKVKFGKVARTEMMEVQAGIALRKSELLAARQAVAEESNRILSLLNTKKGAKGGQVVVAEVPFTAGKKSFKLESSLDRALQHWPEVLIARKAVEQAAVQRDYAKNQTLPRLDLTGAAAAAPASPPRPTRPCRSRCPTTIRRGTSGSSFACP